MLSPNPKIMAHCAVNKSSLHANAADCLIEKLILNPMLVGTKRREKLADLIDKFKDKYGEFTSQRGRFAKVNGGCQARNGRIPMACKIFH
jgi:hypothetical protein